MTDKQQDHCPHCIRFGFPILPVRYAIARHDDSVRNRAPGLQAPFGQDVQQIALPPESATYTLRVLRNGYLYVFDEARNEWSVYQVDRYGDLTGFDIRAKSPPPQEDGPQAVCSRHGAPMLAKCIVVPDAGRAGKLWLAFSGAQWTPETWRRHHDSTYRQRHMRCIDVAGWAATAAPQPHMDSLYRTLDGVAEFALASDYAPYQRDGGIPTLSTVTVLPGSRPFDHGLSDCNTFDKGQVDLLRAQAQQAARQASPDDPAGITPALLALADPVGIAADLNQLALERIVEWEQDPERQEKKVSASAILSLREAIRNGALEEEQHRREDQAFLTRTIMGVLAGPTARNQVMAPLEEWDDDRFRIEDEEEVRRLGEESWKKYRKHLKDGDGYETWLTETYPAEQKAFYQAHVQALDEAFVRWLQAPQLHEHMVCNFDTADIDSGLQYQEAVAVMLQDAASRGVIHNHIAQCLHEQDPERSASIILRAQVWNQDKAVAAWKSAVARQGEGAPVNWSALSTGLFNALKELLTAQDAGRMSGGFENLAKYIQQLSGPLTGMVGHYAAGLATGAVARLPHRMQIGLLGALVKADDPLVEIIDLVGHVSPQNASRALAATIAAQAGLPDRVSGGRPAREALRAGGAPTSGPGGMRFGFVVLANAHQVRLMSALNIRAVSPGDSYRDALPRHYRAYEFRGLLRQSIGQLGNRGLGLGVAGLIIAGGSLGALSQEYAKAAPGARGLKAANFSAGVAGLLGATAEVVGKAGERLPWFSQKLARPGRWWARSATTRAALIASVGRWLTGIGGVVAGGVMVVEGWQDLSLSPGYGVTMIGLGAATGVIAGIILFGAVGAVTIIFLILVAVVSVVVAWFRPDGLQRWLDKVMHFGSNVTGVYPNLETQVDTMKVWQEAGSC